MLGQVTANLSSVSLVVSIVALIVALFSLPASIMQYVTWVRDAALWIALAFVVAVMLKVGYQRSYGEGKPVSQALMELFDRKEAMESQDHDSAAQSTTMDDST